MPRQKDLKRIVRARMKKTGETYTTARLHLVRRNEPAVDYSERAGMSDDAVRARTGHDWREWVAVLDRAGCKAMPHREIARYVASLGISSWWSQSVTVGYERIRGLREKGQRCDGDYEATKSRTFAVPVAELFRAFEDASLRLQWLPVKLTVRSAARCKRMRIQMEDRTLVEFGFFEKGELKSSVAVQHSKLPDKESAEKLKSWWAERFNALGEILR